ncbi:MAG: GNAT family N-acetyltransferase [Syntrophaceae bacterium]|nr:GNAT family N-acetyltransferase [Syntrophaceae bacterium]
MNILLASSGDEPWIKQLLTLCGLPHEDLTPEHLGHFWIIKEKGEILGSVGLEIHGRSALLRSLAVNPRFRKRGFASELAKKAEDYAASLHIQNLYLLTMTAESFFRKRGYQKIERNSTPPEIQGTTEFQSLCPASSVCMVKALSF